MSNNIEVRMKLSKEELNNMITIDEALQILKPVIQSRVVQDWLHFEEMEEIIGDIMPDDLICQYGDFDEIIDKNWCENNLKNCGKECTKEYIKRKLNQIRSKKNLSVDLPCQVGDKAYYVSEYGIIEIKVDEISFKKNNIMHIFFKNLIPNMTYQNGKRIDEYYFYFDKVEAEQKFKEMEGTNG